MKKLFLLIAVAVAMAVPSIASAQNLEDVVHLKNGSVIKGVIVEQVPNESIKIQTRDGNIFVYQMSEVQKLTKEANQMQRGVYSVGGNRSARQYLFNKPTGYMGLVELGGGIGVGDMAATRASLTMVNGYRVLPQFAVGLGVGVEYFSYIQTWDDVAAQELSAPIFLHLRSDFIDGKVSPYFAFNVGYNLSLSGGYFGGIMLEPSVGVGFNVGAKSRMTAGVSFQMNRTKMLVLSGYSMGGYYMSSYYEEKKMGNALKLKLGFSF